MTKFYNQKQGGALHSPNEKLEEMMLSGGTSDMIVRISVRHNTATKIVNIAAVVGYVLLGLTPIKEFIPALQEEAGLDAETAKRVAYDIRAEIFAPVARELAAIQPGAVRSGTPSPLKSGFEAARETRGYAPRPNPNAQLHEAPPEYRPKLRNAEPETQSIKNAPQKITRPWTTRTSRIRPNIPGDNVVDLRETR